VTTFHGASADEIDFTPEDRRQLGHVLPARAALGPGSEEGIPMKVLSRDDAEALLHQTYSLGI